MYEEMAVMLLRIELYYNDSSVKNDGNHILFKSIEFKSMSGRWSWPNGYQ